MAYSNVVTPEYKIILLGEPGVGKTSYFFRVRDNIFLADCPTTACTGVEHLEHTITVDGTEIKANVFDTAGGERFRTLTSNYFMNADAAILMYSIEDQYSFERTEDEVENAHQFIDPDDFVWALIGNKADLPLEIEESSIRAKGKHLETSLLFYTSAKSGINVKESLEAVMKYVHRKRAGLPRRASALGDKDLRPIVVNTTTGNMKAGGGCC